MENWSREMWSLTLVPSGCDRSRMMRAEPSGLIRAPSGLQRKKVKGWDGNGPAVWPRAISSSRAADRAAGLDVADELFGRKVLTGGPV